MNWPMDSFSPAQALIEKPCFSLFCISDFQRSYTLEKCDEAKRRRKLKLKLLTVAYKTCCDLASVPFQPDLLYTWFSFHGALSMQFWQFPRQSCLALFSHPQHNWLLIIQVSTYVTSSKRTFLK